MPTTTNRTILRMYCKQIDINGTYDSASDEAVLQTTMDYASEAEIDIDDAARSLELAAQRIEVTTNELVAAVTCVAVYTQCRLREALWQLERVVKTVREIEQGLRTPRQRPSQCRGPGGATAATDPARASTPTASAPSAPPDQNQ